jgi:hypothetical protein
MGLDLSEGPRAQNEGAEEDPAPLTSNNPTETTVHSVARATYPVPPPLAKLLQDATSSSNMSFVDSPMQALTNILDNSIQALDQWYFGSLPSVRKALMHRTCLRISAHSHTDQQTLTITDLGIGMTRADLINLLGVGRPIQAALRRRGTRSTATSSTVSTDEDDEDDEGDDYEDSEEELNDSSQHPQLPRCKTKDIGGFYAAVCSLAVGVRVGTKVSLQVNEEE